MPFTVWDADRKPIPGLVCTLQVDTRAPVPCTYTGDDAVFVLPIATLGWGAQLTLSAPQFSSVSERVVVTRARSGRTLTAVPPIGQLVPANNRFVLENGGDVRLIGINAHQLRDRWQHDRQSYAATRDQYLGLGFTVLRVASMCNREREPGSVYDPDPSRRFVPCGDAYDDAYYATWRDLAKDLAAHGAYLHIDTFWCATTLMPDAGARQDHWRRMQDAVRGLATVLLTVGNELDNSCNQITTTDFALPTNLLAGAGSNGGRRPPPRPWGAFEEYHSNTAPEPQRESHNAMEFNQGTEGIPASRVPIILSEMPRPDQMGPAYKYFDSARAAELLIAFSEYHCDRCRFAALLEGDDLAGAREHVAGALSMPLRCKTAGAYDHGQTMLDLEREKGLLRAYRRGLEDPECIAEIRH